MDAIYPHITRQTGLVRELDTLAQNIANANTTGYKAESLVFAEHVTRPNRAGPSLSMGHATARFADLAPGALTPTGGALDLGIEGEGFFTVGTPDGDMLLTRAGHFVTDPFGTLMTPDGLPVLGLGGAPVQIPLGPGDVAVARDGTVSKNGQPIAQIGLVTVPDSIGLQRVGDTRFRYAPPGGGAPEPMLEPRILQGHLETSNTQPVVQMARLIAVENAYAAGQSLLDREDERMRAMIRMMEQR